MTWNPFKLRKEVRRQQEILDRIRSKLTASHLRAGIAEGWIEPSESVVNTICYHYSLYDPNSFRGRNDTDAQT